MINFPCNPSGCMHFCGFYFFFLGKGCWQNVFIVWSPDLMVFVEYIWASTKNLLRDASPSAGDQGLGLREPRGAGCRARSGRGAHVRRLRHQLHILSPQPHRPLPDPNGVQTFHLVTRVRRSPTLQRQFLRRQFLQLLQTAAENEHWHNCFWHSFGEE